MSTFLKNLTDYLGDNKSKFKSVKTMLQSVIMRSLLERDFCSTEICHFVNHDYTNFSCKFITVNLIEDDD